jgi:hypothetical protein
MTLMLYFAVLLLQAGEKGGLGVLLQCLSLASQGDSTGFQELAQEAVQGVELLCRGSFNHFRLALSNCLHL